MGDYVVQLPRDPRPLAPGGVLEQVAGRVRRAASKTLRLARGPAGRRPASAAAGARATSSRVSTPASESRPTGCVSASTRNASGRQTAIAWALAGGRAVAGQSVEHDQLGDGRRRR